MKKILVISSSPRKGGNSDLLCDRFIEGAQENGHHIEKILLKDKIIRFCRACDVCKQEGKSCPQNDDVAEILQKMIDYDVIVMATPVYFYAMSGQLKTLIDRTCARYTEITGKEFYFIATAADTNKEAMERAIENLRGFTMCLDDAKERGVILGAGAWAKGDIKTNKAMQEAYEMGKACK